jgi:conjugative transfer signal peptidase TraF
MKLRTQRIIGFAALGYAGLLLTAAALDLHPNVSESTPMGIWKQKPLGEIRRGTFVSFCLDPDKARNIKLIPGSCPDTFAAPFLKPVAAIEGDTVQIRKGHLAMVNGKEMPNTVSRPSIEPFPDGTYLVKPGEVWVLSSYSPRSFDSRYYGPVSVLKIQGEAIPLLVLDNSTRDTGDTL